MYYDRRLLAFCDGDSGHNALSKRLCEYQQDLHDVEVKLNKFNRTLRRPLIHIRNRNAWVQKQIHQEPENFDDIYEHYRATGVCGRSRFVKGPATAKSEPQPPETRVWRPESAGSKSEGKVKKDKIEKAPHVPVRTSTSHIPIDDTTPRRESGRSEARQSARTSERPADPVAVPERTASSGVPSPRHEPKGPILQIMSLQKLPRGSGDGMYHVKVGFDPKTNPANFVLGTISATKAIIKNGKELCVVGQSLRLPIDDRPLRVGIVRNKVLIGTAKFNCYQDALKERNPPVVRIKDPSGVAPIGAYLRVRCGAPENATWENLLSDDEDDDDEEEGDY